MFSESFIKSPLFASLLKEASSKGNGKVSSTMENLYRLAQSIMVDRMQFDINEIVQSRGLNDQEKYNAVYQYLKEHINDLSQAVIESKISNPIGKSRALTMINDEEGETDRLGRLKDPKQPIFLDYNTVELIKGVPLSTLLEKIIFQGIILEKQDLQKQDAQILEDDKGRQYDQVDPSGLAAFDAILEEAEKNKTIEVSKLQKMRDLQEIFEKSLEDKYIDPETGQAETRDLFSFYVESKLLPQWKSFAETIKELETTSDLRVKAELEEKIDQFYNAISGYIGKRLTDKKRTTETNTYQDMSTKDIEIMISSYIRNLDFDKLANSVLESSYHGFPKWVKRNFLEHKEAIKLVFKVAIRSSILVNLKSSFGVSMSMPTEEKGGKLNQGKLLEHILHKEIKKIQGDPETQKKISNRALLIFDQLYDPQASNPTADLDYQLYQNITPMVLSGLILQAKNKIGKDFVNISEAGKAAIVNELYSKIYPYFPHYSFKGKGKYKMTKDDFGQIQKQTGGKAEQFLKRWLMNRLNDAIAMERKEKDFGDIMLYDDPVEDFTTEPEMETPIETPIEAPMPPKPPSLTEQILGLKKQSHLDTLIQKYAQKLPQPVMDQQKQMVDIRDSKAEEDLASVLQRVSNGNISEKLNTLQKVFSDVLGEQTSMASKSGIFSFYVENHFEEQLYKIINLLKQAQTPEEKERLEEQGEIFFNHVIEFVTQRIGSKKRITQKNIYSNFTVSELDQMVNEYVDSLDINDILNFSLSGEFYKFPKYIRNNLGSSGTIPPEILLIFKSILKAQTVKHFKQTMNVPVSDPRGQSAISQSELTRHFINREVAKSGLGQETLQKALNILNKYLVPGGGMLNETAHLDYAAFQHSPAIILSGLIAKKADQMGDEFLNMSLPQKRDIAGEIYETYKYLPHYQALGKNKFTKLSVQGKTKIIDWIIDRINDAINMKSDPTNKKLRGTLMKNSSTLKNMIKKYASRKV